MNKDNLIPVGDRYLVQPYKSADESSSGLSLENNSNVSAAPVRGTVLKSGDKAVFNPGDEILFRRYSIDELKFVTPDGEQTVYMVEGNDIVAVVKVEV